MLNVGVHTSLGRDPAAAVALAADQGFQSMQIFASSPGAWKPPVLEGERIRRFVEARDKNQVQPLFIHAIYLINLASVDRDLVQRAKSSLIATLEAGAMMGASAVITHIGSRSSRSFNEVCPAVSAHLRDILDEAGGEVDLALENSAGAGGIIGSAVEELGALIDRAGGHTRLKVVLDTAHLCGAGWDFQCESSAARLVELLEQTAGSDRLVAVHANDSLVPCGSRKDRHQNIGDGAIGMLGFANLMKQDTLRRVPWILETPNLEKRADDLVALKTLAREAMELPCGA